MKREVVCSFLILLVVLMPTSLAKDIPVPNVKEQNQQVVTQEVNYYALLGNEVVAKINNNEVEYYHKDRLGSNIVSSNEDVSYSKTLPFGEQISNDGIKYSFTGKELDSNNLYYFGARYYNPDSGRFLSTDPVMDNHAYVYTSNNPLMFIDPSGKDFIESTIATGTSAYNQIENRDEIFWNMAKTAATVAETEEKTNYQDVAYVPDYGVVFGKGGIEQGMDLPIGFPLDEGIFIPGDELLKASLIPIAIIKGTIGKEGTEQLVREILKENKLKVIKSGGIFTIKEQATSIALEEQMPRLIDFMVNSAKKGILIYGKPAATNTGRLFIMGEPAYVEGLTKEQASKHIYENFISPILTDIFSVSGQETVRKYGEKMSAYEAYGNYLINSLNMP